MLLYFKHLKKIIAPKPIEYISRNTHVVRHSVDITNTKPLMTFRLLLYSFLVGISFKVTGQISLRNPQICYNNAGYLKCYYDGSYLLKFDKGNFTTFSSTDSNLKYSDIDKTLTFYSVYPIDEPKDTVQIKLLQHSILISNRTLHREITSLPTTATSFDEFNVGTYTVNDEGRGLTLLAGRDKNVEIEVWPWKQGWQWNIVVRQPRQTFLIKYNGFRKNRVENIILQNDSLRYGMGIFMTFKSLRKLSWLRAVYVATATINGRSVVKDMPTENPYWYRYKKNGKADKEKSVGEMKLCDCE
jgi:hypothetical protein